MVITAVYNTVSSCTSNQSQQHECLRFPLYAGYSKNVRVYGRGITILDIFHCCMENAMKELVHVSAAY